MNLNKAFVLGNVTKDPQIRVLPSGQSVATFGMATNSFYKDSEGQRQKKAEFHSIVVFGKQAEIVHQYVKKGSMILIEGRIQTRNWKDQAGQTHWKTEIVCETLQLGPRTGESGASRYENSEPRNVKPKVSEEEIPTAEDAIPAQEEVQLDDLPL